MNDLYVIQELESILNRRLTAINSITKNPNGVSGYVIDELGYVRGLALIDVVGGLLERIIIPIEKLRRLEKLELSIASIQDISPLKNLTKLKHLSLMDNQIKDISLLKKFQHLEYLDLMDNKIEDISPLMSLGQLTFLSLILNRVEDISPLSSFWQLKNLFLAENGIEDIEPLKDITTLTHLELSHNVVVDITPLKNLLELSILHLSENLIRDISPLEDLSELAFLSLSDNQIKDIAPLKKLFKLQSLHIDKNEIKDITPLIELSNLKEIIIGNNQIQYITLLKGLSNLVCLDLQFNKIKKLPYWITDFKGSIFWSSFKYHTEDLNLYKNPLQIPPVDVVKQGKEAIKAYFDSIYYVAPLPLDKPSYSWSDTNTLIWQYKYDFFLPEDFFSDVIRTTKKYAINDKLIWQNGIVTTRNGAIAEITECSDARTIQIKVAGKNRRELIRVIVGIIDELNVEYGNLKSKKVIL